MNSTKISFAYSATIIDSRGEQPAEESLRIYNALSWHEQAMSLERMLQIKNRAVAELREANSKLAGALSLNEQTIRVLQRRARTQSFLLGLLIVALALMLFR